ncbi:MAG TPA: hypothetical protein VN824_17270 [Puia sp.]|nr:hypothetical protein [Puia sp.]
MKFEEFKASLDQEVPPAGITASLAALWYAGKGDWEQAHTIAQDIPTADGAWVHAYLHRQEGDEWNANYWYNRAERSNPGNALKTEWKEIVATLLGSAATG